MSSFKPATPAVVENYKLENVETPLSPHGKAFLEGMQEPNKDFFLLNPEISHFIGLTDAKTKEEKRKFDAEVFKYVQKIKDAAFQEAYDHGLKEGIEEAKKEAFNSAKQDIGIRLRNFSEISEKINQMSQKIFEQHEKDIIDLSYLMAEKIVHQTLKREPDMFLNIFSELLKTNSATQIQISEEDYRYFEENKDKIALEIDLAKIKVESSKDLQPGDVLFSNDLGILDGTLKSRFELLRQIVTGQDI